MRCLCHSYVGKQKVHYDEVEKVKKSHFFGVVSAPPPPQNVLRCFLEYFSVILSVQLFFCSALIYFALSRGSIENKLSTSQGRVRPTYTLPSLDLTCRITLGMLFHRKYKGSSFVKVILVSLRGLKFCACLEYIREISWFYRKCDLLKSLKAQ